MIIIDKTRGLTSVWWPIDAQNNTINVEYIIHIRIKCNVKLQNSMTIYGLLELRNITKFSTLRNYFGTTDFIKQNTDNDNSMSDSFE